jgi:hypothetical protein
MRSLRGVIAAAAISAAPSFALAVPKSFIFGGANNNWNAGANWNPAGEPALNDDAFVTAADALDRSVVYNTSLVGTPTLSSVHVDQTGAGTLTLSQSGQSLRALSQYVGETGTGAFFQTGGTNQASTLYLGFGSGASGAYTMTNTARLQVLSAMYVGYAGTGTFNQAAGNVVVDSAAELVVAYFPGSHGAYAISGGTLATPSLRIADDAGAVGHFDQSGGTVNVSGDALLASFDPGSTGTYVETGGTLNIGRNLVVGERGAGTFLHGGGNVFVNSSGTNGLVIGSAGVSGAAPASAGAYDLSGSALLSVTGRVSVGLLGEGSFTQSGGTHNVTGDLVIAGGGASGQYVQNGGTLTASGIRLNSGGVFTRNGGTLFFGTFTQDGGAVNGTLTNSGSFVYNAGAFNGRLVNLGGSSVTFNADFVAGDGIDNFITLGIDPALSLAANGFGLFNNLAGRIEMTGGVLGGSGKINNAGTIFGFGTIEGSGGITNDGDWLVEPGDMRVTNTGPLINNGGIIVASFISAPGVSLVLDSPANPLQNNGVIVLQSLSSIGGAGSLVNNPNGTINANNASINVAFTNHGTVNIGAAGAGALQVNTELVNTGTINLTGALTALTGGKILNNGGTISGTGEISSPIANSGIIQNNTAGGVLDLGGEVTNLAAGQINIGANAVISANLISSAGQINLTGGTLSSTSFANSGTVNLTGGTLDADSITNTGTLQYAPPPTPDPVHSFGAITNSAPGRIRVLTGASVIFYNPIAHNPGAAIEISTGASASFLAGITGGGAVTNSGTLTFAPAAASDVGPITTAQVGSGIINIPDDAVVFTPRFTQTVVNLEAAGANLVVTPAATSGTSTSKVISLNIAGGAAPVAKLDLANTNLVIDYVPPANPSPLATVRAQLRAGYNNGLWNGDGIASSSATASPTTALGYGEASSILGLSGGATANWNGQLADSTSVLIGYTKYGDANLDHTVNFSDLVALAQNYNTVDGSATWNRGDFDYDGNVTFVDLVKLAQNYNGVLAADAIPGAPAGFGAELSAAFAEAPEPSAGLLAGAAVGLAVTRRRRKAH